MNHNKINVNTTLKIAVSGSSGSGKSTILKKLLQSKDFNNIIRFSVSHTTRKPRSGEVDGKDYHFVTKDVFHKMIENQEFLEYATYNDNLYGTSYKELCGQRRTVEDQEYVGSGLDLQTESKVESQTAEYIQNDTKDPEILVLDLERKGIEALKKCNFNFKFIYINCDKNEIRRRLLKRLNKTNIDLKDLEEIEKRIGEYDKDTCAFQSTHYDLVVNNYDLVSAVSLVEDFLKAQIRNIQIL